MTTETPNSSEAPRPPEPLRAAQHTGEQTPGRVQQFGRQALGLVRRIDWRVAVVLLVAAGSVPVWRAVSSNARSHSPAEPASEAQPVAVARVSREDLYNEVTIPAEFRPYQEVELHAKVSGYVSEINVDFGDQVKSNQLIATLEVPELHDELNRALAAEKRAEADYKDAHLIYTRLLAVNKDHPNLVAQQDLDSAEAKDGTADATIAGAKADAERYQTMIGYTRIIAPFDGVVTHRYVDKGALIQAGTTSETQSLPVVRVSDNYRLRLDFHVSSADVKDIRVGDPVEVRVESLGTNFTGTITRSTLRVNEDTRTMTTEIEVPNPDLKLVPGMYNRVVLKVSRRPQALAIPIEAVPAGQTNSVYVINDQNQIEERPVTLGVCTPTKYEVTSGLKEGELVLRGTRSLVKPGQKVEPKKDSSLAQQ